MKNLIILISGKQGSGKTALAQALPALFLPDYQWSMQCRMRFAASLYELHDTLLPVLKRMGIVHPSCVKDGPLLQVLGTEYGRKSHGENVWVDIVRRQVDAHAIGNESHAPYLITIEDARFENEFTAFPDAFRVRLEAERHVRQGRCDGWRSNDTHPSETGLDDIAAVNGFDLMVRTDRVNADETAKIVAAAALMWYRKGLRR